MQKNVVIASLLKPVDDIRSFRKIGLTLSGNNGYSLTHIGPPANGNFDLSTNVRFVELPSINRLSLKRLFRPWLIYYKILQLQPDALIITSHELLFPALLIKFFKGTKIVYDLQENYFRNLWYQNNYPRPLKWIMACYVRTKEYFSSRFINVFLLAEKCYLNELTFVHKCAIVLENKALFGQKIFRNRNNTSGNYNIVFTGTISENSGITEIQKLIVAINQTAFAEKISFAIVGQYHSQVTKAQLNTLSSVKNVDLIVSNKPIDYNVIYSHIMNADFGILCYHINPSNKNRTPTKVFEYMAANLPILYQKEAVWGKVIEENCGGFGLEFHKPNVEELYAKMRTFRNVGNSSEHTAFLWKSEQDKLINAMASLFS